jgi:hypothetical protein
MALALVLGCIRYLWLIVALAVVASEFTEADVVKKNAVQNPIESSCTDTSMDKTRLLAGFAPKTT